MNLEDLSLSSLNIATGHNPKKWNLLIHRCRHLISALSRGLVCRRIFEYKEIKVFLATDVEGRKSLLSVKGSVQHTSGKSKQFNASFKFGNYRWSS